VMKKALLVGLAALGSSGCIFVSDDDDGVRRSDFTGTLLVDWTVDGTTDGDQCDQADAVSLRLSVFTVSGSHVGDFRDDWRAFSTAVELDPGRYYADAVLEDGRGQARTTSVNIDVFSVRGADTLSIPIDFPASSFY